jgi:hypothetical protein
LNVCCHVRIVTFFFDVLKTLQKGSALADYDCKNKKDAFYSDPEFCHIYWRCNYGMSEEYECPAGTAWNHKEGRCDWLDNVDCSRDGTIETASPKPKTTTTEEPEEPVLPPEFPTVTDVNGALVFSTTPSTFKQHCCLSF